MGSSQPRSTIAAFHRPGLQALNAGVLALVTACNSTRHLKALRWRTIFQVLCEAWNADPGVFKIDPHHLIPGPCT